MSTTRQRAADGRLERDKQEALNNVVGEQLIHILGKPEDLLTMQVRRLWKNSYRINIVVGTEAASGKIARSYFVKTDDDDKIVGSDPAIAKQY